ncbi:hypothetical protein KA107_01550 [Candidatus Pacearchaeota archaeon]|nr:hypothetical protein [Candidatus Pacearchaeota archaeon]
MLTATYALKSVRIGPGNERPSWNTSCPHQKYPYVYCPDSNRYRDIKTGRYAGVIIEKILVADSTPLRFLVLKKCLEGKTD